MDKENLFNNTNGFCFPAEFPYEFASPSSTESESDDDDVAGLTRRFSRSTSLQEPFCNLKEKRVFSGSPESTLGSSVSSRAQAPSQPPFLKADEDAWNLIYAAAGQVARMKMRMSMNNGGVANKNNRGLLGAPRAFAHPHSSPWGRSEGEDFFRQQPFCNNRGASGREICGSGWCGCACRGARPPSFPHSAWPLPQVQNQRLQQHCQNQHKACTCPVIKPVLLHGSGGGCDGGGGAAAKRECAGTGVFLPRRYCNNPPETRRRQACSPANPPARMSQSSSNDFDLVTAQTQAQAQASINGGFLPHYEMLMSRRNGMMLAAQQRRSNIHGGAMEVPMNNPEVLLPQEWTY